MPGPDPVYQDAVEREIDRLARLSPCELMQLRPRRWELDTDLGPIELVCQIQEFGDVRYIAVMAERPVMLGLARRRFASALEVKLSTNRLSGDDVAALYD